MNQGKLKSNNLVFFILAFFPVVKTITMPSILAKYSSDGCLVSAIALILCDLLLTYAVMFANSYRQQPLEQAIGQKYGKVVFRIFYLWYAIYFILKAFLFCCENALNLQANLYDTAPSILIFVPFFIFSFYACVSGIKPFFKCSAILCVLSVSSLIFIFSLTFTQCNWEDLLPLFNRPVLNYSTAIKHTLFWFDDGLYLLFISDYIEKKGATTKAVISTLISSGITAIFIAMFYSVFSFIAPVKLYAATQMSKYGVINSNILRFDQFAYLIIIFVNVFAISIPIVIASDCLKKGLSLKGKYISPSIINLLLALIIIFMDNKLNVYMAFLYKYLWHIVFFTGYVLPIIVILPLYKSASKNTESDAAAA